MGSLLAQVLPLAAGAALSPGLLALQMLNLSRPTGAMARAWAVAAGAAAVVVAVSVGALFLTLSLGDLGRDQDLRAAVRLLAAVVLLGIAGWVWAHPPDPDAPPVDRTVGGSAPVMAGLGAGLIAPNMAVYLPAAHEIARSGVETPGKVVAFVLAAAIALLPVLTPPLAVAALGERARPPLEALNGLVTRNSRRVTIVACIGFAIYLAITGVSGLGG